METNETDKKEVDFKKILSAKFPEMMPIKNAPGLGTLNSLGFSVYGKSNFDQETNTYTKYYAICALFIPLFYLGAYRVADAQGGGWYFLGKEKLNKFTKYWNYSIIALILGGIGYAVINNYISSPEYQTEKRMAEVDKIYQSGKTKEALKEYIAIIDSGYLLIPAAVKACEKIYNNDLGKLSKEEFTVIWKDAGARTKASRVFPNKNQLTRYGNKYFEVYKNDDMKMSYFILNTMADCMPEDKDLGKKFQAFNVASFDKEPSFVPFAIAKAIELENQNDLKKCEEILTPLKSQLKDTEGAKILGNIYFQNGDYTAAYELLKPYFESKIKEYHIAEKNYQSTYKTVSAKINKDLNDGSAGQNWYDKYEKSTKAEKEQMDDEYLYKELSKSNALKQANENLNRHSDVVNIALQLGIVLLNIASQSAEEEKIKRLKEAEAIFLSVQGAASDSDAYQLTYGEVLFWLGKQKDGEKQFNNFLEKHNNDALSLENISYKYRSIGDLAKARELAEKAYDKSTKKEEKEDIAAALASMPIDTDYSIKWLEKSNQNDLPTKAAILKCKGLKAVEKANLSGAENFYREAILIYEKLPDESPKFNNMSLAYSALYQITYKLQDLQSSVDLLKKARELKPKNTTILSNYLHLISTLMALEEMEKEIDLVKIKGKNDNSFAHFNATSQEEKKKKILKFTENSNYKTTIPLYEQLALLAPQSQSHQNALYFIYFFKRDIENINKVLQSVLKIDFNYSEYKKEISELYANKKNDEYLEKSNKAFKLYEGINSGDLNPENASDIILCNELSQFKISKDLYGKDSADFLPEISFFEKSFKIKPREYVLKSLASFYLYQGLNEIYNSNEVYKKEIDKYRAFKYSCSHATYMLYKFPDLKPIFSTNKNIEKYIELIKNQLDLYPESLNISGASFLNTLGFDKDNKLKNQFKNNLFLKPDIEINYKLYPLTIDSVLEKYFFTLLFDNEKNADEIIKKAIQEGVPL